MRRLAFSPKDDDFHFDSLSDRWWETETCWFSFMAPERKLGGWVYIFARPNVGAVAGGAWVWDDSAHLPWEVLYNANYTTLRLPKTQNLSNITLPTGARVKALEPLQKYAVGFEEGDRIKLDLVFDAIMAPMPIKQAETSSGFGRLDHFDQFGRVTGTLNLQGEMIAIDCLSMRDRSWGPRPEHRPRPTAYVTGISEDQHGFLAVTNPAVDGDPILHGFLLRNGEARHIERGNRVVERDRTQGWISRISVAGTDEDGRTFRAQGVPVSRIIINRHTFIDCNSLVRWTIEGDGVPTTEAWGEDQDMWPIHRWADYRRKQRASNE